MSRFEAIRELYGFKDEPRIDLPLWHKWANCVDDFEKLSTEEVYDKFGEKGLELQTNQCTNFSVTTIDQSRSSPSILASTAPCCFGSNA